MDNSVLLLAAADNDRIGIVEMLRMKDIRTPEYRLSEIASDMTRDEIDTILSVISSGNNKSPDGIESVQRIAFRLYDLGWGDAHMLTDMVKNFPRTVRPILQGLNQ